jgi:hypothetical protein
MKNMNNEIVRIFKCQCDGNKYKLAGEPNENPTLNEKREYEEYIAMGCTVVNITIEQFRSEDWKWCNLKNHNKTQEDAKQQH